MSVDQEPNSDVTAETNIDEIDGEDTTCFMTVMAARNYGREMG